MGALRAALPALLLALTACGRTGPGPELTFDFIVYGDCRHFAAVHRRVCASMLTTNPKFVVCTGDLLDEPDKEADQAEFRDVTRELRSKVEYLPAQGDHDGEWMVSEFGLPRKHYDQRRGDVHLFFLDSTKLFDDETQLKWLEEAAAASDARHKFVVFHNPPFTIDKKRHGDEAPIREKIHGLLVKLKVCAAFCGHDHYFYTTVRDGVRYVVTGGSGAPLRKEIEEKALQPGDQWRLFFHYVGCIKRPDGIDARVIDQDGDEAKDLAFPVCRH